MSLEYGIIDEEMESLVHLEDLKLVIRESELDRWFLLFNYISLYNSSLV